jgi:mannose-1-phosphate guanylyltransferase
MNDNMEPVDNHVYALIMAGGVGSSLWPLSRRKTPKQFVHFFDNGTMIEKTVARTARTVSPDNIYIITNRQGRSHILKNLVNFNRRNIIVEPASRDTAPCIALATAYIKKRDPDAVTIVFPSDHLVFNEEKLNRILKDAISLAREKQCLVTIGIHPDRPETRYGYIQVEQPETGENAIAGDDDIELFKVRTFAEKPDYNTAVQFLQSRDFYWNSGIFIWHVDTICKEFSRSMPDLHKDLINILEQIGTEREHAVIEDVYSWIHPISVDYGIMEKADSVYMLAAEFGWTDLGSWDEMVAVSRRLPDGAMQTDRNIVTFETENVYIRKPEGKAVVVIGMKDVIVVDTKDALLVCRMGESQQVGKAVDSMRREGFEQYL